MTRPRHMLTGLALVGLCACSGCGLVPIPVARTLPGAIRQIDVVEEGTGDSVSAAEVVIYADRFENWIRSFPPQYSASYIPPGAASVILPLKQESSGCFTPGRRRVWRYIRFWGFGPLGTSIHEDYAVTVSARADKRGAVTATYYPTGGFTPRLPPGYLESLSLPRLLTNGTLIVYLGRRHAEPDAAAPLR